MMNLDFYRGKKVFITGHTGFKGTWLCEVLLHAGAEVTGYALEAPTDPSLFALSGMEKRIHSIIGDVRDFGLLSSSMKEAAPEIVFHLAAQPLVRESYREPMVTYETNVMGTVHVLESVRQCGSVRSFLNVTTDKVYYNDERNIGFQEDDKLDGYDPYSNSKSCSELVTHSYQKSFLQEMGIAVSTARAGNVIGGGDFAADRIVPDCVRAAEKGESIIVRHPESTRPFQHVLEPLYAYLMIAMAQYKDRKYAGYYNVGPDDKDCVTTGELVDIFVHKWGQGLRWENRSDGGPHEANFLKLNCDLLKKTFGWTPRWDVETAIDKTVEWSKVYLQGGSIPEILDAQIEEYLRG